MKLINFYKNLNDQTDDKLDAFIKLIILPTIASLIMILKFETVLFVLDISTFGIFGIILSFIANIILIDSVIVAGVIFYLIISDLEFNITFNWKEFKRKVSKAFQEEVLISNTNMSPKKSNFRVKG